VLKVHLPQDGFVASGELRVGKAEHHKFYESVAAHLTEGAPLAITPESARRNIAVIEAAEQSSKSGKPVKPAHE
jgi:hypothetical protein